MSFNIGGDNMPQAQNPGIIGFLPFLLILALFYFLIVIPQRKQQKKHQQMINDLKKNEEVVTVGGVHGVIVNVKDKTFVLRVDDNTRIEVDKTAISYKLTK